MMRNSPASAGINSGEGKEMRLQVVDAALGSVVDEIPNFSGTDLVCGERATFKDAEGRVRPCTIKGVTIHFNPSPVAIIQVEFDRV
jgi:hypothetical protein